MKGLGNQYLRTLQGRINLSFLLIIGMAVISFMFISIRENRKSVEDISTGYTGQLVQMVSENIDSYITNMENIAEIVTENSDVKNFLFSTMGDKEKESNTEKVGEQFETLRKSRKDINNIGILGENGRYFINSPETEKNPYAVQENMDWYREVKRESEYISSSHVQNIVKNEYSWVITLSRFIPNGSQSNQGGVFFIDLNYSSISNLCEEIDLGQRGYVFVTDENGKLIYHPKQQLIYSGLYEEEPDDILLMDPGVYSHKRGDRIYSVVKSELTGWNIVGVVFQEEMLAGAEKTRRMYYLMAVVLLGVALLLSMFLADMITKPLRQLRESMKQVETGNFNVEIMESDTKDEISGLIHGFRIMTGKISQLIEKNNEEQEEKRRNELNALQAQINPHFLYNTLDSIIWMAEAGNTGDVVLMTSALAKLLRRSISNQNELVTVMDEMEYTKGYLTIQKMRYRDKLEYSFNIDPDVTSQKMIKLIIQPLVENAIYHGIKNKEGRGRVDIEATRGGEELLIIIRDDGVGMDEEKLSHILEEKKTDTNKNSVGTWNVHKRIRLYYGDDYGLRYESVPGQGTTVFIRLPNRMGEQNEQKE